MSQPINVLMSGNKNYLNAVAIALLSIAKQPFARERDVHVTFLTMDLTDRNPRFNLFDEQARAFCEGILRKVNPNSTFKVVDCTDLFHAQTTSSGGRLADSVNIKTHFSPYVMLRLLADLVDLPDRFVYLDGDVVVNGDLGTLYDYTLPENCELGVVQDAFRISTYFNAGVMLVNMARCRQTGLFEKARSLVIKRRMMYVDQEALNRTVSRKVMLPLKFNAKDKYFDEIVVHHFCNVRKYFFHRIKPWEVKLVREKLPVYNWLMDEYEALLPQIEAVKQGGDVA